MTALQATCPPFSARILVNDLRLAGVSLLARAGRIHWRKVNGYITPDQADQLRQHRGEVLAYLSQEGADHEHRPGVDGLPSWLCWADYWAIRGWQL